jgi:hypothetical protein
VESGTNQLVGVEPFMVRDAVQRACSVSDTVKSRIPPLWDGHAAIRIGRIIHQFLQQSVA